MADFDPTTARPLDFDPNTAAPVKPRGMVGAFGAGAGTELAGAVRAVGHVANLPSVEQWAEQKRQKLAPTPEEQASIPLSVARGVGGLAADIPAIIATGAVLPEVAGAGAAGLALRGIASMTPVALNAGINTAADLQEKGVDSGTATKAGIVSAATTAAMGAVPLSLTGGLLKRAASGAASGLAVGEVQRQSENAVLADHPELQSDFSGTGATTSAVVGAMLGGIMGPRPLKAAIADVHTNAEADLAAGEPLALPSPEQAGTPANRPEMSSAAADMNAARVQAARDAEEARRNEAIANQRPGFELRPSGEVSAPPEPRMPTADEIKRGVNLSQMELSLTPDMSDKRQLLANVMNAVKDEGAPKLPAQYLARLSQGGETVGELAAKAHDFGVELDKGGKDKDIAHAGTLYKIADYLGWKPQAVDAAALQGAKDATTIKSPASVDVRQQAGNGEAVGGGNAKPEIVATKKGRNAASAKKVTLKEQRAVVEPAGTPRERRATAPEVRAKFEAMTPEQRTEALVKLHQDQRTSPLTGLPNKLAYEETQKLPVQIFADIDNLKKINDTQGHEAGNVAIKAMADSITKETGHAYHISGDEFHVQAKTIGEAKKVMEAARTSLAEKGYGFSYGYGKDIAKAESKAQEDKQARKKAGLRTERVETVRTEPAGRYDKIMAAAKEKVGIGENIPKTLGKNIPETLGKNIPEDQAGNKAVIDDLTKQAFDAHARGDVDAADALAHQAMLKIIEAGPEYQKYIGEQKENETVGDTLESRGRQASNPASREAIHDVAAELLGSKEAADKLVVHVDNPWTQIPEKARAEIHKQEAKTGNAIVVAFAHNGKMYVMDKQVQAGKERAVILHEIGVHLGMEKLIGKENFSKLANQIRDWAKGNGASEEVALAQKVRDSVNAAATKEANIDQETVAYFVQHAVESGINPTNLKNKEQNGITKWLRKVWLAMRAALYKLNVDPTRLTAQDVVDMAHAAATAEGQKTPYATAPDSLMGYKRTGPQTPYEESNYKKEITVKVTWPDGTSMVDGMRGLNTSHAMERARRNWGDAKIELISEKAYKPDTLPSMRVVDFQAGPNQAAMATDAVLRKATGLWDGVVKPALLRQHLHWAQMTHIADVTENLIPHLATWAAGTKNPIREKIDSLMASGAMAKQLNHKTRQIADSMDALKPKQKEALFDLMGKYQLAKVFPNLTPEKHVGGVDPKLYREAKQLYDQPGVAAAYNSVRLHNQYMHDAGMAALMKSMGHMYGAPEELWNKINALDGMSKDVTTLHDWVKTSKDIDLQEQFKTALALHEAKKNESYFHIGRDGDFMVQFHVKDTPEAHAAVQQALASANVKDKIVVNPGDTKVFSKFETFNEMLAVQKQLDTLSKAGHLEGEYVSGKITEKLKALDSSAPSFIRGMLAKIDADAHLDSQQKIEQQELLRRLYIDMLPESSVSKYFARRAGVPGYSSDMHRSFVKRAAAASYFVAQNATRPEQSAAMARLREATAEMGKSGSPHFNPASQEYATSVLNELNQRTANILTPLHTPVVDMMGALGHTFYLSASPGFILQNLAQPYQLTLPYLGGRHGFRASSVAMASAVRDVASIIKDTIQDGWKTGTDGKSKWMGILDATISVDRAEHLTPIEKTALKALIASGRADWTQGGELSRIQEGSSPHLETALKSANLMTYYGEALNRMQSGLAAFRLEIKRNGGNADAAHEYMIKTVDDTQINYAPENRARAIGKHGVLGQITPLVFAFQQFNLGVVQLLGKLTLQAVHNNQPGARAEAVKAIGGLMATTGVAAGTMGLPFVGAAMGAYNLLMGSEDSPVDAKTDYQNFWADIVGVDAAQIISHGAANYISGADVASKLGQENVIPFTQLFSNLLDSRMALKDKIGSGALNLMGPVVNGGVGVLEGLGKISDGDTLKGLAQMSPAAFKGTIKAVDIANNGFTDSKGNKLPMEATTWDTMVQASGFTPTKLATQREAQQGVNAIEGALKMRAGILEQQFADAVESKDMAARQQALQEIAEFRKENPEVPMNLGAVLQRRAKERAIALASGTAVQGKAKQLAMIKKQTVFAAPALQFQNLPSLQSQ